MGILRDLRFRLVRGRSDDEPAAYTEDVPRHAEREQTKQVVRWGDVFPRGSGPRLCDVVGEASYMPQILALIGEEIEESCEKRYPREVRFADSMTFIGELVRERKNRYDAKAVTVLVEGRQVGYLSRAEAAVVAPVMDREGVDRIGGLGLYFVWCVRDEAGRRVPNDQLKVGAKFRW